MPSTQRPCAPGRRARESERRYGGADPKLDALVTYAQALDERALDGLVLIAGEMAAQRNGR